MTKSAPELPVLHRLAIVYLMLPVVVWLVGWFEWWLGIPVAALLVCALRRPLSGSWRPRAPSAAEVAALAVAAGVVMMTAAGGVFDVENSDWTEHRATLLDLGRYPWPTYLPDPVAVWRPAPVGEAPAPPLLRYYLGWHMAPGLVAHWFGPAALSWAVPLWTWAGVALVTLLFTRAAAVGRSPSPSWSSSSSAGWTSCGCRRSRGGSGSIRSPSVSAGMPSFFTRWDPSSWRPGCAS